jgi:hypothetical protein
MTILREENEQKEGNMPRLAAHDQKVHIASFRYRFKKQGQQSLSSEMHYEFQLTLRNLSFIFQSFILFLGPLSMFKTILQFFPVVFFEHSIPYQNFKSRFF